MHIVIALLGAIAGVIWALNALSRSGFSFDSLNPFAWYRRHKWLKQLDQSPAYLLNEPMEVAGLLSVATARFEGEITREMKDKLIRTFENEFGVDNKFAYDLFVASSFILQKEPNLIGKLNKVVAKSKDKFSKGQFDSIVDIIETIAVLEGPATQSQLNFIQEFKDQFKTEHKTNAKWS